MTADVVLESGEPLVDRTELTTDRVERLRQGRRGGGLAQTQAIDNAPECPAPRSFVSRAIFHPRLPRSRSIALGGKHAVVVFPLISPTRPFPL